MILNDVVNYQNLKALTEQTVKLFEEIERHVYNPDHWRVKAFKEIIQKIADNNNRFKLTHKEVITYAKSLLLCMDEISLWNKEEEVKLLLLAISKYGLNHYQRSFLASQIIEFIETAERDEQDWKEFRQEFGDELF